MSTAVAQPRLVAIEIENFMSIESARLEFDESGILNLCGYNDSGKSAITRALEVVLYDAYSNDQVNYIQDDKEHFGVGLEFSDGVSVNKFKYSTGKSVWEMLKGSETVFTNRLANGVAAMSDIPDAIAQYLGVVKDDNTDEKLNVRRNTDKLFLIQTSGSENYKIINSVLRCDVLAESVKQMNEDRNKLQSEVTNLATSSKTLKGELESMVVLDEDAVSIVDRGIKNIGASKQRLEYLTAISAQKDVLDSFVVYDELPMVDTSRLTELTHIQELKVSLDMPIYTECTVVDTSRLQLLAEILQLREALNVPIPPEVAIVDISRYTDVVAVGNAYNMLWNVTNTFDQTVQEHDAVVSELAQLSQIHGFKICKTCGTVAV